MSADAPPCLTCDDPRAEWPGPEHEFSPCCSDECLAIAVQRGTYDPCEGHERPEPPSTVERVEALFEKQLAYMEDHQRGPLPFVPSGDTAALRDLAATIGHLLLAVPRSKGRR